VNKDALLTHPQEASRVGVHVAAGDADEVTVGDEGARALQDAYELVLHIKH
jgi:hypothetical protein